MAVTETSLTSGSDTSLTSTKTTASVTLGANQLVLLAVATQGSPAASVSSISSTGATWELVRALSFNTNANRLEVWRTMVGTNTTGALSIALSAVSNRCTWSLSEYATVTRTGTNGSDAVVQSGSNTSPTLNSVTVTLAAFASASNAAFGAWTSTLAGTNVGSGFTLIHTASTASPRAPLITEWRNSSDTTVDFTGSGSGVTAAIGIEIAFATGTNTAQALAVTSTFSPAISKSYGKILAVDSAFDATIGKAISKTLAVASSFATGFSTFASNLPGHTDISLAANSVFTAAMDVLKLGKHGNHSLAHKRKTNHRVWTRKG